MCSGFAGFAGMIRGCVLGALLHLAGIATLICVRQLQPRCSVFSQGGHRSSGMTYTLHVVPMVTEVPRYVSPYRKAMKAAKKAMKKAKHFVKDLKSVRRTSLFGASA